MKICIKLMFVLFISTGLCVNIFSQPTFKTGKIGVELNDFGRIRIYAPTLGNYKQIERTTILVSTGPGNVYDYMNDATIVTKAYSTDQLFFSDFELVNSCKSILGLRPSIIVNTNVYGWDKESFVIVKFTVNNNNYQSINPYIGIEIIPCIDNEFGFEYVKFNRDERTVVIYKSTYVGFKFIKDRVSVMMNFSEWYYDYFRNDSTLFDWLTNKKYDSLYIASSSGSIVTLGLPPVTLAGYDTAYVYLAIAYGKTEAEMRDNLALAVQKQKVLTNVEADIERPLDYILRQNYPNPFNPTTKINFSIPSVGANCCSPVQLKVYNILGNEVATLINEEKNPGNYEVDFNAEDLPSGIYFYRLTVGERSLAKKMILMK